MQLNACIAPPRLCSYDSASHFTYSKSRRSYSLLLSTVYSCLNIVAVILFQTTMDHSEFERNLLSEKEIYENSDADSETSGLSWNPKRNSYFNRVRSVIEDSFDSRRQKVLLLSSALLNTILLITVLSISRAAHNECNCLSPTGMCSPND